MGSILVGVDENRNGKRTLCNIHNAEVAARVSRFVEAAGHRSRSLSSVPDRHDPLRIGGLAALGLCHRSPCNHCLNGAGFSELSYAS